MVEMTRILKYMVEIGDGGGEAATIPNLTTVNCLSFRTK